jgi:hypothetical protein
MLNGVTSRLYIFSAGSEKAAVQGSEGPFLYMNPLATNENPVCQHVSYIAYVILRRAINVFSESLLIDQHNNHRFSNGVISVRVDVNQVFYNNRRQQLLKKRRV